MSTYKTKWGRNIAVLMAAALVFTGLPGTEAQAAKKAKLSTKKLTITVGKKKTIKIKNKAKKATYKFKSKKASIAKVSKKGVVTGKKKGSTKITVTEKKGKKTRKLGTVSVKVNPAKKPVVTNAPVQPTAPVVVPSANPNQPTQAPGGQVTSQPSTEQPATKAPTAVPTEKATKPPTLPPTAKPTPTSDPYNPAGEGWQKLDLSSWSGGEGNFFETGNQFLLDNTELETVPLPETPAIDTVGQKVEILIRGSLAEQASGFRFWLANAGGATLSQQYYFTESSVGIGQDAGNEDAYQLGKPFHIQATLEHTNHDGSEDMLATTLLLKGPSYGTYLEGVTITGIWIRYGDKIGSSVEDPDKPGVETPGIETPGSDTSTGEKPGETTKPDVALTVANSYAAGPLFDADGNDLGKGIENSDGSITFYTSAKYSGGGLNFYLNEDKSHFDYTKYSKIRIKLSGKETDPDALGLYLGFMCDGKKVPSWGGDAVQAAIDGKPNAYPTMTGGDADDVFEMDLSDITIPSDTDLGADCGIIALQIKYNGYQKDESVKSTVTVKSIELIEK